MKQSDIREWLSENGTGELSYREIFEHAPAGYVVCRDDGQILMANREFYRMTGGEKKARAFLTGYVAEKDHGELFSLLKKAECGTAASAISFLSTGKRQSIPVAVTASSIVGAAGLNKDKCILCILTDMETFAARYEEIAHENLCDAMTGLFNRRFYTQFLKQYDERSGMPFSVMVLDLNGLKMINDSLGHQFGDKAIIGVADALKKYAGPGYQLARIGGDEIVGLFPETEPDEVQKYMERVEREVASHKLGGLTLSFSWGMAVKRKEEEGLNVTIHAAEDAMYSQKVIRSTQQKSETVDIVLKTLFQKSPRFHNHCRNVSVMAAEFGRYLGYDEKGLQNLQQLGYLHDIGMASMSGEVLDKNVPLKRAERLEVKRHPEVGYRILYSAPELRNKALSILYHHENWDGSGYPYHISGDRIPEEAMIIHIVDTYDRARFGYLGVEGKPQESVLADIRNQSGKKFSPRIAEAFETWMRVKAAERVTEHGVNGN